MNCKVCGAELGEGDKFCSSCGSPVVIDFFCSNCGEKLSANTKFCPHCGAPAQSTFEQAGQTIENTTADTTNGTTSKFKSNIVAKYRNSEIT